VFGHLRKLQSLCGNSLPEWKSLKTLSLELSSVPWNRSCEEADSLHASNQPVNIEIGGYLPWREEADETSVDLGLDREHGKFISFSLHGGGA
jgi:hypothetical protein